MVLVIGIYENLMIQHNDTVLEITADREMDFLFYTKQST